MQVIQTTDQLYRHFIDGIPLVRAMQASVRHYDSQMLSLQAPLLPNANDKGCGFGGSIVSLLTLAGWGLVTLRLGEAQIGAEVFVMDSNVQYLAPIWTDWYVVAEAPEVNWEQFVTQFQSKKKSRAAVLASAYDANQQLCATLQARFVAKETEK